MMAEHEATLDMLINAHPGARVEDFSGDKWKKNDRGNWDCDAGVGYLDWSSESLFAQYGRGDGIDFLHDGPAPVTHAEVANGLIAKEELLAFLEENYPNALHRTSNSLVTRLLDHFDLKPARRQFMEVTLRIPVEDMNPMGDTYTDAVGVLNDFSTGLGTHLKNNDIIHTAEVIDR